LPQDKGNGKKDETPEKISCFLCNGSHQVFECLKHGKLAASVMEEEMQEKEGRVASVTLLSVIQAKAGEQTNGRIYIQTKVGGKKLQATLSKYRIYGQGVC